MNAKEIYDTFVNRKDVFAKQQENGMYFPERRPITIADIEEHLSGKVTYGLYAMNTDNTVKWCCIDIDVKKKCGKCKSEGAYIKDGEAKWICPACGFVEEDRELSITREIAETIFDIFPDYKRILEFSGRRGYHIWIFFKKPTQALFAVKIVKARLNRYGLNRFEVFPKQTELNEGRKYGNLVKIPFAVHRASGQRSIVLKTGIPE
jgi:hypothetical protein